MIIGDINTYNFSYNQVCLYIDCKGLSDLQCHRLRANIHDRKEYNRLLMEFGKITIIVIHQFYKGKHYYLTSNQKDIHFADKYFNYDDAFKEALKHTTSKYISFKDPPHIYTDDE